MRGRTVEPLMAGPIRSRAELDSIAESIGISSTSLDDALGVCAVEDSQDKWGGR